MAERVMPSQTGPQPKEASPMLATTIPGVPVTGVIVRQPLDWGLGLDLVEDGFELADGAHVLPDQEEIGGREEADIGRAGIDGDVRELNGVPGEDLFRLDENGFRHG